MRAAVNASILVADDEPNIVLSLEFLLKQAGFRVRTVSDGEAASMAIAQEPPDLVLLRRHDPGAGWIRGVPGNTRQSGMAEDSHHDADRQSRRRSARERTVARSRRICDKALLNTRSG
jgi:CheY-like chemotaxis protein